MTNSEIIFNNRVFLMEQGVIKGDPDQMVTVKDENGERTVPMPEEIYTFDGWKEQGFMVQKGQHSVARFKIWMPKKNWKKDEEDDQEEQGAPKGFYKKLAFFFTIDQVKPIPAE